MMSLVVLKHILTKFRSINIILEKMKVKYKINDEKERVKIDVNKIKYRQLFHEVESIISKIV